MPTYNAMPRSKKSLPLRQKGVAIFVVVIISLIVTLMGVQLVNQLVFGQRSTMHEQDLALAREVAEATLRDAEQDVQCNQWVVPLNSGVGGYSFVANSNRTAGKRPHCDAKATSATQNGTFGLAFNTCNNGYIAVNLNDTSGVKTNFNSCKTNYGVITQAPVFFNTNTNASANIKLKLFAEPFYTVEILLAPNGQIGQSIPYYRIRATATGKNKTTSVTLESIFRPL